MKENAVLSLTCKPQNLHELRTFFCFLLTLFFLPISSNNLNAQIPNAGALSFGTPTVSNCEILVPVFVANTQQFQNFNDLMVSVNISKTNGNNDATSSFTYTNTNLLPSTWYVLTSNSGDDNAKAFNNLGMGGNTFAFIDPVTHLFTIRVTGNPNDCFTFTFSGTNYIVNDQSLYGLLTTPDPLSNPPNPLSNLCLGNGVNVSGLILTKNSCTGTLNFGLAGVDVPLRKLLTNPPIQGAGVQICSSVSGLSGSHSCSICPTDPFYLWPVKDENLACGLNEFDVDIIRAHILNQNCLTSIEAKVAADVNFDQVISTQDILYIVSIINGTNNFPFRSWRFIERLNYIALNIPYDCNNNFGVPLIKEYSASTDAGFSTSLASFRGVKIGDVDFTCTECGNSAVGENETRAYESVFGKLLQTYEDNKLIRCELELDQLQDVLVGTFSFKFNDNEFSLPKLSNGNPNAQVNLLEGKNTDEFHISYLDGLPSHHVTQDNKRVIIFEFEKKNPSSKFLGLQLNPNNRNKVLLSNPKTIHDLVIDSYDSNSNSTSFMVASPNPFGTSLQLKLYAPIAAEYQLSLINNLGQILRTNQLSLASGWNNFEINEQNNIPAGTYILHLNSNGNVTTSQVIKY